MTEEWTLESDVALITGLLMDGPETVNQACLELARIYVEASPDYGHQVARQALLRVVGIVMDETTPANGMAAMRGIGHFVFTARRLALNINAQNYQNDPPA